MTSMAQISREGGYDVLASITLLSPEQHGRSQPTPGREWRCRLKIKGRYFEAKLLSDGPRFVPGARANAKIKFLNWERAQRFAKTNSPLEVWELGLVASGSIATVYREDLTP